MIHNNLAELSTGYYYGSLNVSVGQVGVWWEMRGCYQMLASSIAFMQNSSPEREHLVLFFLSPAAPQSCVLILLLIWLFFLSLHLKPHSFSLVCSVVAVLCTYPDAE